MGYRRRTTRKVARHLRSQGLRQLVKRPLLGLILLGVALFLFLEFRAQSYGDLPPTDIFTGEVVKVSDGDTIVVKTPGGLHLKIRLYGIDAPENGQGHYQEAKYHLNNLLYLRTVQIEQRDKDQYGRVVARVFVGEQAVDKEMVATGQAWFYPQFCNITVCQQLQALEEKARKQKLGLWRHPEAIPPWQWRKNQRE